MPLTLPLTMVLALTSSNGSGSTSSSDLKKVLLLTLILPLALALPIKSELISDIGPGLLLDASGTVVVVVVIGKALHFYANIE